MDSFKLKALHEAKYYLGYFPVNLVKGIVLYTGIILNHPLK